VELEDLKYDMAELNQILNTAVRQVIQGDKKKKTGTSKMRSGSHVQLAALRNRDLELQPRHFSNHGSVERSTACFRHKNVL